MINAGLDIIPYRSESFLRDIEIKCEAPHPTFPTRAEISLMMKNDKAAKAAAAGIVRTHAQTIRPATRHFTAERRVVDPTPVIAPVMV
jgi:hypothetical protein